VEIRKIEVGEIYTNCYVVTNKKETLVIDPGDDGDEIIKVIEVAIVEKYKMPLLLNQKDLFLLKERVDFERIEKFVEFIDESSKITLGDISFQVIETPGHTPGSVSFYCEDKKAVFVGDLLFAGGFVGRTDFEYGDELVLHTSIKNILKLPSHIRTYPGHGPSFLVSDWRF